MASADVMTFTDDNFQQEVLGSKEPVLVDFWAAWCGPCRMVSPELEKLAEKYEGSIEVIKVDVDANPGLSATFRVQGIPAVKAFKDGRVVAEFVGARSPVAVATFFDELLAPPRVEGLIEELRVSNDLPVVLAALEAGNTDGALDALLAEIVDAAPERRERLRVVAVAIFEDLGQDDPTASLYRRRLAAALY